MKKKRNHSRPPQPLQERLKQIASGTREKAAAHRHRVMNTIVCWKRRSQPSLPRPPSSARCHHPVCRSSRDSSCPAHVYGPGPSQASFGPVGVDVNERRAGSANPSVTSEPPLLAGAELAVDMVPERFAPPSSLLPATPLAWCTVIFFAFLVQFSPVVIDVEKITRHG